MILIQKPTAPLDFNPAPYHPRQRPLPNFLPPILPPVPFGIMRIKLPERSIPSLQNLLTILLSPLPTPSPEPALPLLLSNVVSDRVEIDRTDLLRFSTHTVDPFGFQTMRSRQMTMALSR
jgi:hypothetical protein